MTSHPLSYTASMAKRSESYHLQATNHLSIDDVVNAHQRVLLISTISLQAVLSRSGAIKNRVAACWWTTQVY